ncbi:MAG: glycosyltransferase family 2 protein [Chitinophagaceae bacterium]
MLPLTVIIMARNEAHRIERCLLALQSLKADILVATNQCTDNTAELALAMGARVVDLPWQGFAATKNAAQEHARFHWILSLDADEVPNETLCESIIALFQQPMLENSVWSIKRRLVIGEQVLYHGSVSNEYRVRLFHRNYAHWNTNAVHEDIIAEQPLKPHALDGWVWHYSFNSFDEHRTKLLQYAQLFAKQYAQKKSSVSVLKPFSAYWGFIKNYGFRGGFLDGRAGLEFALNEMHYTRNKYRWANEIITSGASEFGK